MDKLYDIALISLNEKFCKSVSENLADVLEMYHADCEEMVTYDLLNPKEVVDKCGLEYFKKREKAVIQNLVDYENTILSVSYNLLKSYPNLFKNTLLIYLQLPTGMGDKVPNNIDFDVRDKFLSKTCQIKITLKETSLKKCVSLILSKLGEYYENC